LTDEGHCRQAEGTNCLGAGGVHLRLVNRGDQDKTDVKKGLSVWWWESQLVKGRG
jgi:hypothetical protein